MTAFSISTIAIDFFTEDLQILKQYVNLRDIKGFDGRPISMSGAIQSLTKDFIMNVAHPFTKEWEGENDKRREIEGTADTAC